MRFPHQGTLLAARYATRRMSLLAGLLLGREPQSAFAQAGAQSTAPSPHLMRQLSDVSWRDAGDGLSIAVLEGDPGASGAPYSLLLRVRDGAWIPPHWHPFDKRIMVLSGTLLMGTSDSVVNPARPRASRHDLRSRWRESAAHRRKHARRRRQAISVLQRSLVVRRQDVATAAIIGLSPLRNCARTQRR